MKEKPGPQCAKCSVPNPICYVPDGKAPSFCATRQAEKTMKTILTEYSKPDIGRFAKFASIQEAECYINRQVKPYVLHPAKTRVQEVCEFAHKMNYKRLGVAFCLGLRHEAGVLNRILEAQGFEVVSVCCKVGATPKEFLGLSEEEKIRIGEFESMCNPIGQAVLLNEAGSEFNILVGLCVGHDSLFFKYAQAPTTVLVAKDRVTGHNPAAALYTTGSYYARMHRPGFDRPEPDPAE